MRPAHCKAIVSVCCRMYAEELEVLHALNNTDSPDYLLTDDSLLFHTFLEALVAINGYLDVR